MFEFPVAPIEFPAVDFSSAGPCPDCGAPAGSPCDSFCAVWAVDDLPLLPFSPLFDGGLDPVDPWALPGDDLSLVSPF